MGLSLHTHTYVLEKIEMQMLAVYYPTIVF